MVDLRDDSDRYFPRESLINLNITEGVAGGPPLIYSWRKMPDERSFKGPTGQPGTGTEARPHRMHYTG
jgi:hypothetical protein